MALPVATLVKVGIGILGGTAIVAPVAYSLANSGGGGETISQEEIQRKKEESEYLTSNKDACWEFVSGTGEEEQDIKKLLVCAGPSDAYKSFTYYLYTKSKEGTIKLSSEIKTVKAETTDVFKIVFNFVGSNTKSDFLRITHGLWDFWKTDYDLKTNCQVDLNDTPKKISCKQTGKQDRSFKLVWVSLPESVKNLMEKSKDS